MRRIGVISAIMMAVVVPGSAQAEPPRPNVIAAEYAGITQTEDLRGRAIHDAVVTGIHIRREHRRALRAHKKRVREKQQAEALAAQQQSTLISPTLGASLPQGGSTSGLGGIAQCESGGSPTAVSPDGQYRGKYQFDYGTWASVGGTGDPAAAPESEQDQRAAQLHRERGNAPWPVCGN